MARDLTIVGGGLIGLGIGWRMARSGWDVTVFERDRSDAERPSAASWAAAGMLAPVTEVGFDEPELLELQRASLALYPEFAAEVEADAGEPVGYRTEGTLVTALDADDAAWLRRLWEFQRSIGLDSVWLGGAEAREREPHLSPAVTAGVFAPGDHQVDNRLLWRALRRALVAAGGTLADGVEVLRIEHSGGRVRGCVVSRDTGDGADLFPATRVLVCAGAWSRLLMADGLPATAVPPIRPVKGQLLSLGMTALWSTDLVIRTRRVYLVPKPDGRLVVGATMEEAGFNVDLTAGAVLDVLRDAWEVAPGIHDLPVLETWTGLRPGSRDNSPVLGGTPIEGLYVAAGHYRNGVLLTPITVKLMSELLLAGEMPAAMGPFQLARFHGKKNRNRS